MPEPHAPVKDPEPDSVSTLNHSGPRSPFGDAAALAGAALFGAGSAFVFFHLSCPGPGPARFLAAYDALVGGLLGYCLGVRAVLGVAGAGSVMGSRFLPIVGAAYLGAVARLVLVRFVSTGLWFVTLILPFVGGLFGYLLSPGREQRSATGALPEGTSPQPVTLLRLAALSLAGLAGGFVGATGLGLAGALIGGASAQGKIIETVGMSAAYSGFLGTVLGLPLGIAMGLRTAGTRLGIRGRFWPTAAGAYSGFLVPLLIAMTYWLKNRWLPDGVRPAVGLLSPLLSLVGGLVAFHLCGRRLWRDAIFAVLVLLATTTVVLFDRISTESRRPPSLLQPPAFLPYPGRTFDVHSSAPGATRVYECKVETDDSLAAVVDFYEKALARWENSPERVRSRPQATNVASVNYRTRDRKQSVSVWITVDPLSKKTVIRLQYWKFARAPTPSQLGLRPDDWTN